MTAERPAPEGGAAAGDLDGVATLRVAVIGARRVRSGTGHFLAEQTVRLGAQLVGVVGTRPDTAREAAEGLASKGIRVPAFSEAEDLFSEASPDAVLIAVPASAHRAWLHACLDGGAHALCEKPLAAGSMEESRTLAQRFAAAGLVLAENCQWPAALEAFRALHPVFDNAGAQRFRMLLAPPQRGIERWSEILSHPLSLLQAFAPGPAVLAGIRYAESDPEAADARLDFLWRTHQRTLRCEVVAEDLGVWPRPAEFAFDDALCRRRVSTKGYKIRFENEVPEPGKRSRSVEIGDPLEISLRRFLSRVLQARARKNAPVDEALVRRQALLEQLLDAWRVQRRA
jgi:predicted dehydrogenase